MFKRCADVLLALFLLLGALPALLLFALIIRVDSPGPVLFRQFRMGKKFRPFRLVKLRTMQNGMRGTTITLGADPRITRSGRWMRKYKFDEIPQLWNVLRGDMSIVGPRPVIPELTDEFHQAYERLLQVRPGLTDPASLKYAEECDLLAAVPDPVAYYKTVITPDKLRISADYLDHETFWSDFEIVARTLRVLVPHHARSASADAESPVSAHRENISNASTAMGLGHSVTLFAASESATDSGD